jgi:hypothetical protein
VAVALLVGVDVGVSVDVAVALGTSVGVAVSVGAVVGVAVPLGAAVSVAVALGVGAGVSVNATKRSMRGRKMKVVPGTEVGVCINVPVGVRVGEGVGSSACVTGPRRTSDWPYPLTWPAAWLVCLPTPGSRISRNRIAMTRANLFMMPGPHRITELRHRIVAQMALCAKRNRNSGSSSRWRR